MLASGSHGGSDRSSGSSRQRSDDGCHVGASSPGCLESVRASRWFKVSTFADGVMRDIISTFGLVYLRPFYIITPYSCFRHHDLQLSHGIPHNRSSSVILTRVDSCLCARRSCMRCADYSMTMYCARDECRLSYHVPSKFVNLS